MNQQSLRGKRLGILGLGVENYFLIKWLIKHKVHCHITICDKRNASQLSSKFEELNRSKIITWQLGPEEYNINLDRYDILFRSPGWPMACPGIQSGLKKNKQLILTSPMRLFFDVCPTKNLIGVTGTKGKGTTSSIITAIFKQAKKKVYLAGNIGVAPFSFIDKLTKDDFVILELSSFQLEDLHTSPHVAVMTNFSPEHLAPADPNNPNYHKNLPAYWTAKFNLAKFQTASDVFVVNENLKKRLLAWEAKFGKLKQRVIYFGKSDLSSSLLGSHNQENVAAAVAVANLYKIKKEDIAKAVKNFKSLEHRLEFVRELNKVKYFDDSFATTPEATITALKSFDRNIILLAGGADKGADFKELAKEIKTRVKFTCLLSGVGTPRLAQALAVAKYQANNLETFTDLESALATARRQAEPGDVILLSTGCASFGMFNNYKERGDMFKRLARELK